MFLIFIVKNPILMTNIVIKKSLIGLIILKFTSIILTTGWIFQLASNVVVNNGLLYIKNLGLQVYGVNEDDDDEDIEEHNKKADKQHN
jgi:hypothetical protein